MIVTRRRVIEVGGGVIAALLVKPGAATAANVVEIVMQGDADGSHVWFDPLGIHIQPGQTVRWTNRDAGNSHTATAYHPRVLERPRRIPRAAKPWDSDYLLPDQSFSTIFVQEGVYDYYCVPHEHAGMVGRIVVGKVKTADVSDAPRAAGLIPLPAAALAAFPSVEEILAKGMVRRG